LLYTKVKIFFLKIGKKIWGLKKKILEILTLMNFHEPLEIKCNFQRPSSSDLPLHNFISQFFFKKSMFKVLNRAKKSPTI
jgi:hypothetical protein